ncbi:MAG: DUF4386 domain-containing protein [Thermoleophilia bacterium]
MSRDYDVHETDVRLDARDMGRRAALFAGLLFIVADVATFAGDALLRPVVGSDYLTQLHAHPGLAAVGVFAKLISALAGASIAVAMYQVLKRANVGMALGAVVFRALEATFYLVGAMSLLALLELSRQYAAAGAADRVSLQAIGDALMSLRTYAAPLLGVFAFCVGSFLYNLLFLRARLVPRWLSAFGVVATLSLAVACMLSLFSGNRITSYIPLAFPIFVQELVLAGWLIAKGFDTSETAKKHVGRHADLPYTTASTVVGGAR